MAGRRLERDESAHAVPDQRRTLRPRGRDQPRGPVRHRADVRQCGSLRTAVPGKIDREHAEAVVGEPTALERPDAVIHPRAVEKDDERLARFAGSAACRGEYGETIDREPHDRPFSFLCEARKAWPRSAMMSSAASSPTERRTMSSPTPAAANCSALIC